jgi:CheY-like chemotaxis protein
MSMCHILVVDDDLQHRAAIGLWLRHCGFRVAITDSGASGLGALNDECLSDAEQKHRHAAKLTVARSEAANIWRERVNTG